MDNNTKKCKYCGTDMDKSVKFCPTCKRRQKLAWWQMLLIVLGVILLLNIFTTQSNNENSSNNATNTNNGMNTSTSVNHSTTNNSTTNNSNKTENKVYKLGETWTVDGQWNLTVNSVTTTTERNQFSDKTPAQVLIVDYSYENLGYEDDIMDGLFISLEIETIIDANGEVGYSYPNSVANYPQEIPVGAKCSNAQACIAVDNTSDKIKIIVTEYDSNDKKQKATFELEVQ
ncbi:MAG: hypothetical protein J6A15_04510 [Clostridia bacterium]|nr:hypothetical protein [Clostridia bacterium]